MADQANLTLNRTRLHPFGKVRLNLGFRLWINVGDSSEIPRGARLVLYGAKNRLSKIQTRLLKTDLTNFNKTG